MTVEAGPYPEESQAVLALVLGILSIVCVQPLGIAAWVIADNELAAIEQGRRPPDNRGTASVGKTCGIIGVVILGLEIVALIALMSLGGLATLIELVRS